MMKINYQKIIFSLVLIAIIIRIVFLFFNPITMWADPIQRYIPDSYRILEEDLTFYTPPRLSFLEAFPIIFLTGTILEFSWRFIPFLFFLFSTFIFIRILKIIDLNETSKIFLLCLFLFNVYSLLTSTTIMQEFLVLFFTLSIFYFLEVDKKIDFKKSFLIVFLSALLLYSKDTGLFIFAGFLIYILLSKRSRHEKLLLIFVLFLSFLIYLPWVIKNYYLYGTFIGGDSPYGQGLVQNGFFDFKIRFEYFTGILAMAYRIPGLATLDRWGYQGIFSLISRAYYFVFMGLASLFTICIFGGIIKYSKQYKKYIYLITPIFLMVIWLAFFSPFHYTLDFGRYMFSFYFIYFFFGLKFIENINIKIIRRGLYLAVLGIVLLSVFTSLIFSISFHYKDQEIRKVNNFLNSKEDFNEKFITNDAYTEAALSFYSSKDKADIYIEKNKVDYEIICKNPVYKSKKYLVSVNDGLYQICMI